MSFATSKVQGKAIQVFIVLFIAAVALAAGIAYFSLKIKSSYEKINKENVDFKNNFGKIKEDYAKLQKDYQGISRDRENLLAQVSKLVAEKNLAGELKVSLAEAEKRIAQLGEDRSRAVKQSSGLKEEIVRLEAEQKQIFQEKQSLEEALAEEKRKASTQNWPQEKTNLQKENNQLKSNFNQSEGQISKLNAYSLKLSRDLGQSQQELAKTRKEINELNSRLETSRKDYASAVQKNKLLERKILDTPAKFTELARQNKTLIKQTANMHYNLGVFYTKNKEYARSVAEFEKAVELNPSDAYAYFNLGYIYAEYMVNRVKAIEYFRKYLNLAKGDDKDVDWVRKYIVTWTSYGGKEPME